MKLYKFMTMQAVIITLLSGCATTTEVAQNTIETSIVEAKNIETSIDIAGVFAPFNSENVNSKTSGIAKEVNATVGQKINAGDTIAILDTKDVEAQLAQAKAAYNSAKDQSSISKSNLDSAQIAEKTLKNTLVATQSAIEDQVILAKSNLDASQKALESVKDQNKAQIDQANTNIDYAQTNYDKVLSLYESGISSGEEKDNAEKALTLAKTQLDLAQSIANSSLVSAQAKIDSAEIAYSQATGSSANSQVVAAKNNIENATSKIDTAKKQYEASNSSSLEQAQAAINTIESQLSNSIVSSHISGVIVTSNIHQGELAQAGATLVSIADISKLKLLGTISQESIPYVSVGQSVEVYVDIFPDKTIEGKITSIGPISVSTGSFFPIEITIDNSDNALLAGISGHATINVSKSNSIVIPNSSIIENNGQKYIFVVEDEIAIKRNVVTGLKNNKEIEILTGLSSGEVVVISNPNTLFDQKPILE